MEIIGVTSEFIGTLLIAISVSRVHTRVMEEYKIDKRIIESIKKERNLTIIGIVLIVLGYLVQLSSRLEIRNPKIEKHIAKICPCKW